MTPNYDVITVGGGLAGAALGKVLAEHGLRVLILERERVFRDRVRGEYVHPWGVMETRALGLYELLKRTCGHEAPFRINQIIGGPPTTTRDLIATTPHHVGSLHFYHPEMQEVVLSAAAEAGAAVQRGAIVLDVTPGSAPQVRVREDGGEHAYSARLVVGADGRTSACRKWGGFDVSRDSPRMMIAGVLLRGLPASEDANHVFSNPARGEFAFQVPLGKTRFRCYAGYYQQPDHHPLSGAAAVSDFISATVSAGAPREWFANAEVAGPLASFDCREMWVDHPYRAGVALVGDAAGTSDPTYGCGLSLALRDVRVLADLLLAESDWDAAANTYAAAHDSYFSSLHRILDWQTQLMFEPGPVAAARRKRAFARLAEDPRRAPDITGLGPEAPSDDAAYRNLFGEDEEKTLLIDA